MDSVSLDSASRRIVGKVGSFPMPFRIGIPERLFEDKHHSGQVSPPRIKTLVYYRVMDSVSLDSASRRIVGKVVPMIQSGQPRFICKNEEKQAIMLTYEDKDAKLILYNKGGLDAGILRKV